MTKDFVSLILKPATAAEKRKRVKLVILTLGALMNIITSMTLMYSMFIVQVTSMSTDDYSLLGYSLNVSSVIVLIIVTMWMVLLFGYTNLKDEMLMEQKIEDILNKLK